MLDEVVFDVPDVFSLPDMLDNRYALSLDGISNNLLKRLAAPLSLPINSTLKKV